MHRVTQTCDYRIAHGFAFLRMESLACGLHFLRRRSRTAVESGRKFSRLPEVPFLLPTRSPEEVFYVAQVQP